MKLLGIAGLILFDVVALAILIEGSSALKTGAFLGILLGLNAWAAVYVKQRLEEP